MFSISVTDDHEIVRKGLKQIFADNLQIKVMGDFGTAWELFESVKNTNYDLHIIDIHLPGISGIDAIKYIKQTTPLAKILALSLYDQQVIGTLVFNAGADEFLNKNVHADIIVSVVEKMLLGNTSLSKGSKNVPKIEHGLLSKRELEVFKLTAQGKTNSDIAKMLNISIKTVNTYRARIKVKLNIKSVREILLQYADNNLIDLLFS